MIRQRLIRQRARLRAAERSGPRRLAIWAIVVVVAISSLPGPAAQAQARPATAKEQLEFGVEMAQRELWSEALFRFRQAQRIEPENPKVFNNLAVAHEALGLFEQALDLYRRGLELAPQDKALRNNYARFVDFYQRFKPDEPDEEADSESEDEQPDGQPPTDASPANAYRE